MAVRRPDGVDRRDRRLGRLFGVGAAVLVTAGALAAPAEARPIERGVIHDEFTEVVTDFCDEPGLTVTHDVVVDGRFQFNTRRPGTPPYYLERIAVSETFTNEEGDWVTALSGVLDKDLKITDNGDGTLTILVLATGNAVLYDSAGTAIARDPGQVRFEILVDHAGTPADPSDDEEVDFLGVVKESTGRSDDFCAAIIEELG
jgi:hypothetical protein